MAYPLKNIPPVISGWQFEQEAPLPLAAFRRLVPTDYLSSVYNKRNRRLGLFIAYYAEQRTGESMHSPKQCLPGSGWEIWDYGSTTIRRGGKDVVINKYRIQKAGVRQTVLYWYQSRNRVIASEYLGKFLLVRDALLEGRTAGAIVRIVLPDRPEELKDGLDFAGGVMEEVQRCFGADI
jgi:EpsI family protein